MKLTFRPLEKTDFEQFARWLAQPYVQRWWREPATVEHVAAEYGACTRGDTTTRVYVVEADERPIGIMQSFWLHSYPEYDRLFGLPGMVSIDYLIGEPKYVGRGVGARMIREYVATMVPELYPAAAGVATSVEVENGASLGALRKAGFEPAQIITGEYGTPERVMVQRF